MILRFPIFRGVKVSDIDEFAAGAEIKEFLPDEIILSEGKKVDSFYLVMQGAVRMEKMVSVKSNNNWPKSKDKWQNVSKNQTIACTIGEVLSYEHFCLRECLLSELGKPGPAQCRYSAKDKEDPPSDTMTVKILKISYQAFKKSIPKATLRDVMVQNGINDN